MPEFEIDYGALTIDTCIFISHGLAIEKGLFRQLDQFSESIVKLVMSDIVHRELQKHLTEKTKDARAKVSQALSVANSHLLSTEEQVNQAKALLFGSGTEQEIVESRLAAFCAKSGISIVESATHVDLSRLVQMYFDAEAPFENTGDKKSEFPDALALLAIEEWADNENIRVLAVSTDKGWKEFASTSNRIDVIDNLGAAIAHFQPHNAAKSVIGALQTAIGDGVSNPVLAAITRAIADSLDHANITVEASADYYFEEDDIFATYLDHEFHTNGAGIPEINLIRAEADCLVLQLTVTVTCVVHCSFALSVWDSIDKEYVQLGSTSVAQDEAYETEILLSLSGNFANGLEQVEVAEVEVLDTITYADFGYVEADYGGDDDA